MKKILATAAVVTAIISTPAYAWGDREQGILTGIVGTLILQDVNNRRLQQPVVTQPRVINNHYHNNYSVERCAYQENVFRNGYTTVVEKRNSCTGQLIERREYFR